MTNEYQNKQNQNKGIIPVTKEQEKCFEQYVNDYYMSILVIISHIFYLLDKLGLIVDKGIKHSNIGNLDNLVKAIVKSNNRHQEIITQIFSKLQTKITKMTTQDIKILEYEFSEFPKEFKRLVTKLKLEINTEENKGKIQNLSEEVQNLSAEVETFMTLSNLIYDFIVGIRYLEKTHH